MAWATTIASVSIPVALPELATAIERFPTAPYLLTAGADGRPHAVSVAAVWRNGSLVCGAGRRTAANVAAQSAVSLLWPPAGTDDYSLIVDGDAIVSDEGLTITPTSAVLHRSAPRPGPHDVAGADDTAGGCASDCVPVPLEG